MHIVVCMCVRMCLACPWPVGHMDCPCRGRPMQDSAGLWLRIASPGGPSGRVLGIRALSQPSKSDVTWPRMMYIHLTFGWVRLWWYSGMLVWCGHGHDCMPFVPTRLWASVAKGRSWSARSLLLHLCRHVRMCCRCWFKVRSYFESDARSMPIAPRSVSKLPSRLPAAVPAILVAPLPCTACGRSSELVGGIAELGGARQDAYPGVR